MEPFIFNVDFRLQTFSETKRSKTLNSLAMLGCELSAYQPFQRCTERPFVLDASRLVWRVWTGRLPTGIDKVCLAYLKHYGPRSLAFVQRGSMRLVLDPASSDALFEVLQQAGGQIRSRIVKILAMTLIKAPAHAGKVTLAGKIYLNIGHTGLGVPDLPQWLKRHGDRKSVV